MMSICNNVMTITSGPSGALRYIDILSDEFLKDMLQWTCRSWCTSDANGSTVFPIFFLFFSYFVTLLIFLIAPQGLQWCLLFQEKFCAWGFVMFIMALGVLFLFLRTRYKMTEMVWKQRRADFGRHAECSQEGENVHAVAVRMWYTSLPSFFWFDPAKPVECKVGHDMCNDLATLECCQPFKGQCKMYPRIVCTHKDCEFAVCKACLEQLYAKKMETQADTSHTTRRSIEMSTLPASADIVTFQPPHLESSSSSSHATGRVIDS